MYTGNHAMIDIETLGNRPGCVIASIGVVVFNPLLSIRDAQNPSHFYVRVNLDSCVKEGLIFDAGTVVWWLNQSDDARKEITGAAGYHVREALGMLEDFIARHTARRFWCHGATFDLPILTAAYDAIGRKTPWAFWEVRDTRTIFELADVTVQRDEGTHHNALDDAFAQAKAVCAAYRKLGLTSLPAQTGEAPDNA